MYQEFKKLVALAVPVALSQMIIALAGFVDTLMAGRAGVGDLAGVSLGSALWVTLMIAPLGLFMAVNPIVGQYVGSKNYDAIVNFMHQSARVLVVVVLAMLVILVFRDFYLSYFIADQHVLAVTSGYLEGLSWGVPAIRPDTDTSQRSEPSALNASKRRSWVSVCSTRTPPSGREFISLAFNNGWGKT